MARSKNVDHGLGTSDALKAFALETIAQFGVTLVDGKPAIDTESEVYSIGQQVYNDMVASGNAGKSGVPQLTDMAREIQKRFEAAHPEVVEAILAKFPYNTLEGEKLQAFTKAWDATEISPWHVMFRYVGLAVKEQRKEAAKTARQQKAAAAAATAAEQTAGNGETADGSTKPTQGKRNRQPKVTEVAVS